MFDETQNHETHERHEKKKAYGEGASLPAREVKPMTGVGMGGSPKKRMSLIASVLDSHEVVRRQLLHLEGILTAECELILIDDGSEPALEATCVRVRRTLDLVLHATNDKRPWTQPRGRNIGASLARSDRLLFFDIDHILTREVVRLCMAYSGDKLHWARRAGVLDDEGRLVTDRSTLAEYGLKKEGVSVHGNSFMVRRELFRRLGGYDERFCGRYGGDDIDFNERYERLCRAGMAQPAEVAGEGYVFPNPARDVKGLFHSLPR
jgi:hypothetical protein